MKVQYIVTLFHFRKPSLATSLTTHSPVRRVPVCMGPWSLERFRTIINQFLSIFDDWLIPEELHLMPWAYTSVLWKTCHWIHDPQKFGRRAILFNLQILFLHLTFVIEKMFERFWIYLLVAAHHIAVIHTKYKLDFKPSK